MLLACLLAGEWRKKKTPNMKWISNVGNDATQQVPKLIAANESKNEPWRLIDIVALWKMEWYKSKLEKLEQKLQIDEISEVNNSARESVCEASTNTKEFMHNFHLAPNFKSTRGHKNSIIGWTFMSIFPFLSILSFSPTSCLHVTKCKNHHVRFKARQPVFSTDRFSFTRLYFFTWYGCQ